MQAEHVRLSKQLERVEALATNREGVSVNELLALFGMRGHWMAIFILTLPFAQPIPMLGLSTIFGAVVSVVAVTLFLGIAPRAPLKMGAKTIPASTIRSICAGGRKIFGRIEHLIKPRGVWLQRSLLPLRISAVNIFILAVLLALPLPIPGSNLLPAVPILLTSLGHIEEDGLLVSVSWFASAIALCVFLVLLIGPVIAAVSIFGQK